MEDKESDITTLNKGVEESGTASGQEESDHAAGQEETGSGNRLPRRYKLYDRIKDHVSVRTIDAVIIITALLIIFFLIIGIVTGNRT